jgi:hypothetical protein
MRSYSKKMRPGREVIILTPRYYVFSLRGETGDSETRDIDGFIYNRNPPALKTYMMGSSAETRKKSKTIAKTSQLRRPIVAFS